MMNVKCVHMCVMCERKLHAIRACLPTNTLKKERNNERETTATATTKNGHLNTSESHGVLLKRTCSCFKLSTNSMLHCNNHGSINFVSNTYVYVVAIHIFIYLYLYLFNLFTVHSFFS